jgi:hypothetical protein
MKTIPSFLTWFHHLHRYPVGFSFFSHPSFPLPLFFVFLCVTLR